MGRTLMIGSCEPFSGKSALILGIARQLMLARHQIRLGKPLATSLEAKLPIVGEMIIDDDVRFVGETLGLSGDLLIPSLHLVESTSADQRLFVGNMEPGESFDKFKRVIEDDSFKGLTILEGAGSLCEGLLYGLSLGQVATALKANVLLVHPWRDGCSVESLLEAKNHLGKNLLGVVLNAVTPDEIGSLQKKVVPAIKALGIDVFGVMPRSPLLRSVTVSELARRLEARVICCRERLELMVETLSIGAMNVNSAMEFFRKRRNMAVVTGADRTDIQLAALEASTQCLILTGAGEPLPQLIYRAEELEVPILKVEHDTLSTVEVIEQAFGHVRLHESVKASYAFRLVEEHCDLNRMFTELDFGYIAP